MFNETPAQNKISYWVSNKWYLHKKLKSNKYILKIYYGYKHSVKSGAGIIYH